MAKSGKNQALDVVILHKGQHISYQVGTGLRGTGWNGGQFVTYSDGSVAEGNTGKELGIVEAHPGTGGAAGFLVFGSSDSVSDNPEFYTAYRPETTGVAAVCKNDGKYKFFVFETDDAAERATPGAGATLVYALNDTLYISDNGLLTNEASFGAASVAVGNCFHVPQNDSEHPELDYVGLDVAISAQ